MNHWQSTPMIQHQLKVAYGLDMSLSLINNRLSSLYRRGLILRQKVPQPSGGYEFHYKESE